MGTRHLLFVSVLGLVAAACTKTPFPTIPGKTDIHVKAVASVPRPGEALAVSYKALYENLGLRKHNAIRPERGFNPFRLA